MQAKTLHLRGRKQLVLFSLLLIFSFTTAFSQTNLDYYLKAAKENSPLVKEKKAMVEKSVLQGNIIKAEYQKPKVFLSGEINYSPLFPTKNDPKAFGYDVSITDGGLYSCLLNVQQPIFTKSTQEILNRQTKIGSEAAVDNEKLIVHQLEKEVTDQYILSYQSLNQIAFVQTLKNKLIQQKSVIEALAQRGLYKRSDLLLMDIEIQTQTTEINNLQAIYNRNIVALNDLCGLTDSAEVSLTAPKIEMKVDVEQSQFIEKFRYDSLQEVANQDVANLKYKPQFNLYGSTGINAIELDGISRKFGAGVGVTMIVPLYDGQQRKYTKQQSDINLRVINDYKQNFLIQKSNRQQAVLSDLKLMMQKITTLKLQLENYEKLIELYKSELQTGELQIINYLNGIKAYTQTRNELTISETTKLLIINSNNYNNW